jgi:hypothetical protein
VHSGALDVTTWRAADGPHRLRDTVSGGSVVIQPGTLVCGGPGAVLAVGQLTAEGTADEPIVFTAEDAITEGSSYPAGWRWNLRPRFWRPVKHKPAGWEMRRTPSW